MVGWLAPLLDVGSLFDHERQQAASRVLTYQAWRTRRARTAPRRRSSPCAPRHRATSRSPTTRRTSDLGVGQHPGLHVRPRRLSGLRGFRSTSRLPKAKSWFSRRPRSNTTSRWPHPRLRWTSRKNATWIKEPDELPATRDTSQMTPEEAARAFFEACSRSDWDEARVFAGTHGTIRNCRTTFGGLKLISIGKSFRSGLYPGRFVPYKIQLKSGEIKAAQPRRTQRQPEAPVVGGRRHLTRSAWRARHSACWGRALDTAPTWPA